MNGAAAPGRVSRRWGTVAAALLYLGAALGLMRHVLEAPSELLPLAERNLGSSMLEFIKGDQRLTVATLAHNARSLPFDPGGLWTGHQCYPTPLSTALGEHMLALSLVGALPTRILGDPILAYNVTLILYLLLSGLAMYAVVVRWTGNWWAALVAGLLFEIYPWRILDAAHIYAVANHWAPLAIYFAGGLMLHGGWRNAFGLWAFLSLTILEGAYPMMALGLFGGVLGGYLVVRHRDQLPERAPALLTCALGVAGVAGLVLWPYALNAGAWETVGGHTPLLLELEMLGPGSTIFPGFVFLSLALVGAGETLWRRASRTAHDLRPGLLLASPVVVWWSVRSVPLPLVDLEIPSLHVLVSSFVPAVTLVRAHGACISVLYVALALLAGYGLHALLRSLPAHVVPVAALLVLAAGVLEATHRAIAPLSFGGSTRLLTVEAAAPSPELRELYDDLPAGPVLDLPVNTTRNLSFVFDSLYTFSAAFHQHRVASCYNSYVIEIQDDVHALGSALPDPAALEALRALGFRSVLHHASRQDPTPDLPPPATRVRSVQNVTLYGLESDVLVEESFAPLQLGTREESRPEVTVRAGRARLKVVFENHAAHSYRHPDPIIPSTLTVRWRAASGEVVREDSIRALLPLALASGATLERELEVDTPENVGTYRLELSRVDAPERLLSRLRVRVDPP